MKRIFDIVVILFCVIVFSTCSNEESVSSQPEVSIVEKFAVCKEIAVYHSEGLDFAFNKIKGMKEKNLLDNSFFKTSKKEQLTFVNTTVGEFMSQRQVVSNLSVLNNRIDLSGIKKIIRNQSALRSSGSEDVSPEIIRLFTFFDGIVDTITDVSMVESTINNALRSTKFAAFSEEEQNILLMMLAIYDDSSNYWNKSMVNWQTLLEEENDNSVLRSTSVELNTPDFIESSMIWRADAIGGIAGGIGGAIGGALAGSLAAGVGVVPGAAIGALSGAISGSVSASITAWFCRGTIIVDYTPSVNSFELLDFLNSEIYE